MRCAPLFAALVMALPCLGCNDTTGSMPPTSASGLPVPGYASVVIDGVPHVRQKPDFCGEAVASSWLQKVGKPYDQDDVFALTSMDPGRGMGATTREMKVALERIGFDVGATWYSVSADNADAELEALFRDMHEDLVRGVPSIVCTHFDGQPNTTEHFRLVLGYDAGADSVVFHDPALDDGSYKRLPRAEFKALWPLKYDAAKWTVIRMRLEGSELKDAPRFASHTPAEYAQHIRALKERAPRGFSMVFEPPFVVLGDEAPGVVQKRAEGTVRWAVDKLKSAYFQKDPVEIIDVWLFKDADSYNKNAEALWDETPSTPYGYYSRKHRAMVMNIATGGGTLVHEIVHPFVEANFPNAPDWFNEGLGSLYEQSADRNGEIVGLTNWRLAGLQRAIRRGGVPSFHKLMHTSTSDFYDNDPGTNYAQSRYLLYYLQERGLLRSYYQTFTLNQKDDPSGYESLKQILDEEDLVAFQQRWESWVLGLRFPE